MWRGEPGIASVARTAWRVFVDRSECTKLRSRTRQRALCSLCHCVGSSIFCCYQGCFIRGAGSVARHLDKSGARLGDPRPTALRGVKCEDDEKIADQLNPTPQSPIKSMCGLIPARLSPVRPRSPRGASRRSNEQCSAFSSRLLPSSMRCARKSPRA